MIISKTFFNTVYMTACLWLFANQPPDYLPMSPVKLFICCAVVSTVAGMASLLRTRENEEITTTLIVSHSLNMGTCGASLAMLLYSMLHPRDNLEWMIIGMAGLFSLGGMGSIDWVVSSTQKMIQKIFSGGKSE